MRKPHLKAIFVSLLVLIVTATSGDAAAQATDGDEAPDAFAVSVSGAEPGAKTRRGPKSRLSVSFSTELDSNPFKLKDSWRASFEDYAVPGGRLHGFASASDLVSRFEVEGSLEWRKTVLRRVGVEASAVYYRFLQNGFSSYFKLSTAVTASAAKGSSTRLSLTFTPDRFKKNYVDYSAPIPGYAPASVSELRLGVKHTQRITKRLDLIVGAETERRSYDAAFQARDRRELAASIATELKLSKHSTAKVRGSIGRAISNEGLEDSILVDRSFHQTGLEIGLSTRIGNWKPSVSAEYRRRAYMTDNGLDMNRFERLDGQWNIGVKLKRPVGRRATMFLEADYLSKESNRPGNPLDPELVPYSRTRVGAGLTVKL